MQEQSITITSANAVDVNVKDVVEFGVADVADNLNRVVALWTTGFAEHTMANAADAAIIRDSKVTGRDWTLQKKSMFNMFVSFMD